MSQKYKSAKITTKDGKESMYVNLYPIEETGVIPGEIIDPNVWNIPEGFYAIKIEIKTTMILKKELLKMNSNDIDNLDMDSFMSLAKYAKLYPIVENDTTPKEILDPEIWNIPEGYYAIEVLKPKKDNNRKKEIIGTYVEKRHPDKNGMNKILVNLYPIEDEDFIPREALDPKYWNIPEGYYAIVDGIIC